MNNNTQVEDTVMGFARKLLEKLFSDYSPHWSVRVDQSGIVYSKNTEHDSNDHHFLIRSTDV